MPRPVLFDLLAERRTGKARANDRSPLFSEGSTTCVWWALLPNDAKRRPNAIETKSDVRKSVTTTEPGRRVTWADQDQTPSIIKTRDGPWPAQGAWASGKLKKLKRTAKLTEERKHDELERQDPRITALPAPDNG